MSFDTFPSATLSLPLPHPSPLISCSSLPLSLPPLWGSASPSSPAVVRGRLKAPQMVLSHMSSQTTTKVCMCEREGVWELGARGVKAQWQLRELRLLQAQRQVPHWRRDRRRTQHLWEIFIRGEAMPCSAVWACRLLYTHTPGQVYTLRSQLGGGGSFLTQNLQRNEQQVTASAMSCRKRCKREILKFAGYLFRFITGTLNAGKVWSSSFTDRSLHHITLLIKVITLVQEACYKCNCKRQSHLVIYILSECIGLF